MHITVFRLENGARGPAAFATALRDLGHSLTIASISSLRQALDESAARGADLVFFDGFPRIPLHMVCSPSLDGVRVAAPPVHTLALLDHPVHWRRVLEREGVPVSAWLHVGADVDVGRDPRVSVLGFPLRVSRALPGVAESEPAGDRDALCAMAAALRNPRGLVVERSPQGEEVAVFTGIAASGPVVSGSLQEDQVSLTLSLARHIERMLELAGPCEMAMTWERSRLWLQHVKPLGDLGPDGPAHRSVGGDYVSFVAETVRAAAMSKG